MPIVKRMRLGIVQKRAAAGQVDLVVDGQHFQRVVLEGMLKAKVSLDISTADFKAMLVPRGGGRGGKADSIVEVLRGLAGRGVEIRLLHAGTPSGPALVELKKKLPAGLTIRRCPRLHAKAVIIDCRAMYRAMQRGLRSLPHHPDNDRISGPRARSTEGQRL